MGSRPWIDGRSPKQTVEYGAVFLVDRLIARKEHALSVRRIFNRQPN